MSSQLDAIKARAEYVSDKSLEAMSCHLAEVDIPALVAAVEAVLGQHEPDVFGDCDTCGSSYCGDFVPVEYPCPTVTAIERALKEEQ